MRYDPVKEQFINAAAANRLLSRAMREPYTYLPEKTANQNTTP